MSYRPTLLLGSVLAISNQIVRPQHQTFNEGLLWYYGDFPSYSGEAVTGTYLAQKAELES